jgi:hypothetical protein
MIRPSIILVLDRWLDGQVPACYTAPTIFLYSLSSFSLLFPIFSLWIREMLLGGVVSLSEDHLRVTVSERRE